MTDTQRLAELEARVAQLEACVDGSAVEPAQIQAAVLRALNDAANRHALPRSFADAMRRA